MVYFYGIVIITHSQKPPDSDIQNKPILILQEAECAHKQHGKADYKPVKHKPRIRHGTLQYNGPKLGDKGVQRIKMLNHPHQLKIQLSNGIEDGRQIHPGRQKRGVDVLDIPEKHRGLREKQPQPHAENVHLNHDHRDKQHIPIKMHLADDKYDQHCPQGKQGIHTGAGHL